MNIRSLRNTGLLIFNLTYLSACTTSPVDLMGDLQKSGGVRKSPAHIVAAPDAPILKFDDAESGTLDDGEGAVYLDGARRLRSYYRTYRFRAQAPEEFIELRAIPGRPVGFGDMRLIVPVAYVQGPNQAMMPVKLLVKKADRTFTDGSHLKTVWSASSLRPGESYTLIVASDNRQVGSPAGSIENVAAAAVANVPLSSNVTISPVGAYKVEVRSSREGK